MFPVRLASLVLLLASFASAQDPQAALAELLRLKDDADPALITKIASTKSREAAEGLVKAYDLVGSLLMQREILRGLGTFHDNPDAEQPALQKVASIAGTSEDAEQRDSAIAALGQSNTVGKHFLKLIVDSEAVDSVREAALRAHVAMATAEDGDWYRFLWNLKAEQRKDKDGKIQAPELGPIRELAFQGVQQYLSEDDLVDTLRRETESRIRRDALAAMQARNLPKTSEEAARMLERVDLPGSDRAAAARILVDRDGPKVVPKFLELAKKRDVTPEDLRNTMAKLIAGLHDDATNKKVAKLVGKGKPHERVFAMLAAGKFADLKIVRKDLADPAIEVRRAAASVLAHSGDKDAMVELRNLLTKGRNPGDARLAIEAISEVEQGNDSWLAELEPYTKNADVDVRNAAVEQIGIGRNKKQVPVLLTALENEDWSTRYAAVDALLAMKDKRAVGPLIERLAKDPGRLGKRIGEVLWQFTAQPFEDDPVRWKAWWVEAAPKFSIVSEAELDKAAHSRELQRLKQRTRSTAKFFGMQIESHRVIFILDVSGSMLESMYGRYVGKRGAARIDVAKDELKQAITNLDENALFNVFAFSSSVEKWQKASAGTNSAASRQAALTWIERLGASGATNLYDSLKEAFADKDVDSIYLLSDGEPTNGEIIDPYRIREEVAFWNKHRKIKINTVAVGSSLEVLEWLAEDSGGKHVKLR